MIGDVVTKAAKRCGNSGDPHGVRPHPAAGTRATCILRYAEKSDASHWRSC
jgi:hypothetical protein